MSFILSCQDEVAGGLGDQPGNMVDIFHTFFGICGLSLLQYFKDEQEVNPSEETELPTTELILNYAKIRDVNPTFALPADVVAKYNLLGQTLAKV